MGKRKVLCEEYLALSESAISGAKSALAGLKEKLKTLDAKADNHDIQLLNKDIEKLGNKMQAVEDNRSTLEIAFADRERTKAYSQKMKAQLGSVVKGILTSPIAAMKSLRGISVDISKAGKEIDKAIKEIRVNLEILIGATKVVGLVLDNLIQPDPLSKLQEMKESKMEEGASDFTEDDLNALDSMDSSCQGKYNYNFKASESLADTITMDLGNAAPSQELKQGQNQVGGITTGNDDVNEGPPTLR